MPYSSPVVGNPQLIPGWHPRNQRTRKRSCPAESTPSLGSLQCPLLRHTVRLDATDRSLVVSKEALGPI